MSIQLLQEQRFGGYAALMLVLKQVPGGGGAERTFRPGTVQRGLPRLLEPPCEVFGRGCEVARSSALANASSSEHFVDVPDSISFAESSGSFLSHVESPLFRPGRPLQAI